MIEISKLRFKNLLSFGNNWTEISLKNGEQTLVVGRNGDGKSAIYEAVYFAFYGKPFRDIKKDELINSTNGKEAVAEVEFRRGRRHFKIIRGIRPNIFEIWIDGELKDQDASVKDYQVWLESNVLKMDSRTFRQVVVLGSTSYVPFMRLAAGDRRIVVEDILNVGIYSDMLQHAKVKLAVLVAKVSEIKTNQKVLEVRIETSKKHHEETFGSMAAEARESAETQIRSLDDRIAILESEILVQLGDPDVQAIEDLKAKKAELEGKIRELDLYEAKISAGIKRHTGEIEFLKNNKTCPTCHQQIAEDFRRTRGNEVECTLNTIREGLAKLSETREKMRADLLAVSEPYTKAVELKRDADWKAREAMSAAQDKTSAQTRLEKLLESQRQQERVFLDQIAASQTELEELTRSSEEVIEEGLEYERLVGLLKDGGVKNKVIRDYLPVINRLMKKYLEILEFPVSFTFDEAFNETIKSRFRDEFSYGNFSAGEKLRIDLALLFTWRELTRVKSSAYFNLLVLDEIGDSSLDSDGFDAFMKIMEADRDKQCAMIISHKPDGIASKVDRVIKVKKVSSFSMIESVTEGGRETSLL